MANFVDEYRLLSKPHKELYHLTLYFSRPALKKYIKSNFKITSANFEYLFNSALKKGVANGDFVQPKGMFFVLFWSCVTSVELTFLKDLLELLS